VVAFAPGLLLIGLGVGVMLTPSVNVVQSSFPEQEQGEFSGLSRSVSNLGSSFGTAIAGTILVSDLASGNTTDVIAMVVLAVRALIGLARRDPASDRGRARSHLGTGRVALRIPGSVRGGAQHRRRPGDASGVRAARLRCGRGARSAVDRIGADAHDGAQRLGWQAFSCVRHSSSGDWRSRFHGIRAVHGNYARRLTMADAGPPLVLMALGLILWLAVNATLAGISIQTIGIILFLVGVVWLLIELVQSRTVARRQRDVAVRDEPVVREREVY